MAFETLAGKLQSAMKKLTGRGKLSEKDVKDAMREVRLALLEADVNYKVAKDFIKRIEEKATGSEVLDSLTPGQQVIKIVRDELRELMGGTKSDLNFAGRTPAVIMMVGLQGAGKTTHTAKLARYCIDKGRKPMLVACDVYRPAAIEQLKVVGERAGVPVFDMGQGDPVKIAEAGIKEAVKQGCDTVFLDTAGRLHIDETLMDELVNIKNKVNPNEILLVVDGMTGQDAVNAASAFDEKLGVTGIVMTKMDGDSRGGAALSCKAVTGKAIKFIGTGEKLGDLEQFHPDRMAGRILGMGDVLSLIEKAETLYDEQSAATLEKKMRTNSMDLQDFLDQMNQMSKLGNMEDILKMVPGVDAKKLAGVKIDEKKIDHQKAIILSMTKAERRKPGIINASRRKRIAAGSGTSLQEVNALLRSFEEMQKMMKQFNAKGMKGMKNMMRSKGMRF